MDVGSTFCTMKVLEHCNKLLAEVVEPPFLEIFKVRLDKVLSNLI